MKEILLQESVAVRYNLYGTIDSFGEYKDFIEHCAHYTENDVIALYINSPGGRVDIGCSLVNSIKSCRAKVTAVVEAPSCSMASIIALACDNLIMLDNTYLMFHNYSTGEMGKGAEFMLSVAHNDSWMDKMLIKHCSPFLTKVEIKRIRSDGDVYIKSDDENLQKRIEKHFK